MGLTPGILNYIDGIVGIRRDIHTHPELCFDEKRTMGAEDFSFMLVKTTRMEANHLEKSC
jgi:hypothetical protein